MKTIFLHIGMHKTGSTAIQSAFDGFDDGVTRYADLGFENHSIPFYTAYSGQHQRYHIWLSAGLRPEEIEARRDDCRVRIAQAVAEGGGRNLVFSGEDISFLPLSAIEEIRDVFLHEKREVRIIVYVREPMAFVMSGLQQMIKDNVFRRNVPEPIYRQRIEKFIRVFGFDSLIIREFDRKKLFGEDIVKDFSQLVGVVAPRQVKETNTSLSTEAIKVIYLLNKLLPPNGDNSDLVQARLRMIAHVRTTFPGKFEMPEALFSGVISADDVEWLHSVSGIDFRRPDLGTPVYSAEALAAFLGKPDDSTIATLRAYLVRHCGISEPPEDVHFLLARYFMSFLSAGWPFGFTFDPQTYLDLNPDVKRAGVDPYQHFLRFGVTEGRRVK